MPIKWVPELDQLLLLLLLDTHPFKIDPDLIVAAWPTDKGDIPTARSITERFVKIRRIAAAKYGKTIGKASGKASGRASGRISINSSSPRNKGGRALENSNVTPHKLGSPAPVTPKNKRTTGKTTPASKKRKVNKESSDAEESSDAYVEPPAQELNGSPSTSRGSQSIASMDTGSTLKTGTIKRQAAGNNLHTQYHNQNQPPVIGDSKQSYSYGQDLPDAVMASELNTDEEPTFSHALQAGHSSMYDYPAVSTQALESDDWTAYQALFSEQANEGSADGPYGGKFGVNYDQRTGHPGDVVYDNDAVYVDSSIQNTPVSLHRQPLLPTAFSAAHNMPQSHASAEADGFIKHGDFIDDNDDERDDARRSASPMPPRPRTRREASRRAAVKHERYEELGTEGSSIGESECSNYTDRGEYM